MLLAIETSSRLGSVVLHDGNSIVAERSFSHGLQNAAKVLPLIDEMCRSAGLGARDLREVAVSVGPGSFTGLRIGVTLAKTLCFVTGAKLIAVPTMPVLASNAPSDAVNVMVILDAKRDQVFGAVYSRKTQKAESRKQKSEDGAGLDEVIAPQLAHLPELLAMAPRPLLVLGEGVKYHGQHLFAGSDGAAEPRSDEGQTESRKSKIENVSIAPESFWYPKASTVAHLALLLKQRGAYADPFKLTPLYIRKPEAQERMEAGLLKHLE